MININREYRDYCQSELWSKWLSDSLELTQAARERLEKDHELQFDHAPEPYLRFGSGQKPFCLLLTNPGNGIPQQHHDTVSRGGSVLSSQMSYDEASLKLGNFYHRNGVKGAARTRIKAIMNLKELIGADCVIQFETVPFHSPNLPRKRKVPANVREVPLLNEYAVRLKAALKSVSVVALSAVGSKHSISEYSVKKSKWLSWQADLLGIDPDQLCVVPLARSRPDQPSGLGAGENTADGSIGKVSVAFLYQPSDPHIRGFLLTMGSNTFPGPKGRRILARILGQIERCFNSHFSTWDIRLPPEDIVGGRCGEISNAGWRIRYLFGTNEKGVYLDYYASHRMTNDRHRRIYANGQEEALPALPDCRAASQDPEEDKRLKAEYDACVKQTLAMLRGKGFTDSPGQTGCQTGTPTD